MSDDTILEVAVLLDALHDMKTDPESDYWDSAFCTGESTDITALAKSFIQMRAASEGWGA